MSLSIIQRAFQYAKEKHAGQTRDNSQIPYFVHPEETASILRVVTSDYNLIAAGLLHDVIEDCGVTREELVKTFNNDVATLVMEVTKEGKPDSHGYYFPRLHTKRGIMLKFADRLSNISHMDTWDEKRQLHYLSKSKFWQSE